MRCTLVTTVMNRAGFLAQTLPTWLKLPFEEIVVVDWSSKDDVQAVIDANKDSRVTRLHVKGQEFFNRSKALNVGVGYASTDYIANVDSDVKLFDGWLDVIDENRPLTYYRLLCPVNWALSGTCIYKKEMYNRVGGYSEKFEGWGWEDTDFFARLEKNIYKPDNIIENRSEHIDHDDDLRTCNTAIKNKAEADYRNYLSCSTYFWTAKDEKIKPCYDIIKL